MKKGNALELVSIWELQFKWASGTGIWQGAVKRIKRRLSQKWPVDVRRQALCLHTCWPELRSRGAAFHTHP